jgi:hypothetical protein
MFSLELGYSVEKYSNLLYQMQPFSCPHREEPISKRNYKISVVQETRISKLEIPSVPRICMCLMTISIGHF